MKIGILQIISGECISDEVGVDVNRVAYELGKHGYFVQCSVTVCDTDKISDSFGFLCATCDAVTVCGAVNAFYDAVAEKYELSRRLSTFLLGNVPCAVSEKCDEKFVADNLIPMLNGRSKTYYATNVFRTLGKTEEQLREALKDYIKNRNKISIKFISRPPECSVLVRYSNKTQKNTVSELLDGVTRTLKDCVYAYSDVSLPEKTARLLIEGNKTVGLAESFTGGRIASLLVENAGVSQSFKESIVCYDNAVKRSRLRVSQGILDTYGAVSIETAYEMAANLLMDGDYDYAVATTGNAGPTSEKPNQVGVCYIAVGDKKNIDIYPCRFDGDRKTVIESGALTALYHLHNRIAGDIERNDENETKE